MPNLRQSFSDEISKKINELCKTDEHDDILEWVQVCYWEMESKGVGKLWHLMDSELSFVGMFMSVFSSTIKLSYACNFYSFSLEIIW